jgi:integrase
VNLTDPTIRSLPLPASGQKDHFDDALAGFGVRVSQGGSRSFFCFVGGKHNRRRVSIGRYGIITLAQARIEARRLLAENTLGKVRPQSITYPQAVELFIAEKRKARKARTADDYERLLKRFGYKGQLTELTHQETHRRMKRFTSEGEYNHLLVALRVFCNWCIKRRYIDHNPTLGLSTHATTTRSRVLTDPELKLIWQATDTAEDLPQHFRTIVKLLILTGQRRGEIAALRSDYISNDTICLPATLTKNGREHSFPIGACSAATLAKHLKTTAPTCGLTSSSATSTASLLFPARGKPSTPFNGWSKSKAALDKLSGVSDWTLHDLRRTFATNLAQMGTAPHVIERLLNHITGTVSGVAAVYNRASYMEEMKTAIGLWENRLNCLLLS